jgi:hypothetical protein
MKPTARRHLGSRATVTRLSFERSEPSATANRAPGYRLGRMLRASAIARRRTEKERAEAFFLRE